MFKKFFSLFAALTLSVGLWAQGSVITYTATEKLEEQFDNLGAVDTHDFNAGVGTVTYNSTITEITNDAFNSCYALQSITLPASILTIGVHAFSECTALQSITLPATLTTIGEYAFFYCEVLQSITLPATITTIEKDAFEGCTALQEVTFLGNACQNAIGEDAFYGVGDPDPALLTLPNSWIGTLPDEDGNWYGGKFEMSSISGPAVDDQFVDDASGLKFEVTAVGETNTVKVINNDYEGTSYTIPASVTYKDVAFAVTEIGEAAFINCSDLTTITFAEGSQVTTIGEAAFNECWSLISIALPASVTTIGSEAFKGCEELPSINLASVTEIGDGAFMGCAQLSSLDIPASLTTIGEDAFILCENIYDVTVHWESAAQLPIMGNGVFGGIADGYGPAGATLHVPAGSASVYDVAPWNTFGTIDDPQFVLPDKTAGQYATICLPKPIASVTNGTLYKISYGNIYEVHFVEEANFTADPAGTPYLVQAEADGNVVFMMADAEPVTAPISVTDAKGFVASLQEELQDVPEGYNYLLVSGGELHSAGPGCQLSKNHAYIDVNYVPATAPEPQGAPRRVVLYNAERQMPTGLYQTQDTKHEIQKLLRNGQMLIIRENKVYNAQGQIVK